jgi:hypothetical protein
VFFPSNWIAQNTLKLDHQRAAGVKNPRDRDLFPRVQRGLPQQDQFASADLAPTDAKLISTRI